MPAYTNLRPLKSTKYGNGGPEWPVPILSLGIKNHNKTGYSVILNEVKDLKPLKIRDSSLRSE
jgi:hypothetical protein